MHAKRLRSLGHLRTDPANTDYPERLIVELGAAESLRESPTVLSPRVSRSYPLTSYAMPILHIPKQLRAYCGGTDCIELEGETASALLAGLAVQFPELGSRVLDACGALAPHIVLIQNDVVLRSGDAAEARVSAGDELRLFTAVSGG